MWRHERLTLSQSMFMAFLSSQLVVLWNPGMTRCSRVRVWMIESISSSRVRSLFTDGDLIVRKKVNKEAKCRLFDDIHVKGSHEVIIP